MRHNGCLIIDVACPFDTRVKDKEQEKIENYQNVKWELKRIWKLPSDCGASHNWYIN